MERTHSSPSARMIEKWMRDGTEHARRLEMYRVRAARKAARDAAPAGCLWAAQFFRACGEYAQARRWLAYWRAAGPYPIPDAQRCVCGGVEPAAWERCSDCGML